MGRGSIAQHRRARRSVSCDTFNPLGLRDSGSGSNSSSTRKTRPSEILPRVAVVEVRWFQGDIAGLQSKKSVDVAMKPR